MHPDIADFAARLQLSNRDAAVLDQLVARIATSGAAGTTIPGYTAVTLLEEDEALPIEEVAETALIAGRYADLGPIGMGGVGAVRRVRDVQLNRTLAMKTLHASLLDRPSALARFLEEAQATAQLQHPNIVPVHDIGTHPDGRVWFTMKEVRGRTLTDVVREVHAAADVRWNPAPSGWTLRRSVASFLGCATPRPMPTSAGWSTAT